MRNPIRLAVLLFLIPIALSAPGCGGDDVPLTLDEIFKQEQALPKLYLTAITQKRVIAPADRRIFTDIESGEVCWPALECQNPACPGKGADDAKFIFISPDLPYVAKPDGTAVPGTPDPRTVPGTSTQCPQCMKIRNRNTESPALKQKYINAVKHYDLPEAAKRKAELVEERKRRYEFEKKAL